jgi:RNA polymerase sigma factor (sigma-70 family)
MRVLVERATCGDSEAWTEIVQRYQGLLRHIAYRFNLGREERDDAVQRTWQRTVEHLHEVRDGAALPGWLATCMRRECLAGARAGRREWPTGDMIEHDTRLDEPDVLDLLVANDEATALHDAIKELPAQQQTLVKTLLETPPPTYAEISHRLGMPVGSIGPTRRRALQRLAVVLSTLRPMG